MEHCTLHTQSDIYQNKILSHLNQMQSLKKILYQEVNSNPYFLTHHNIHHQVSIELLNTRISMHKPMLLFPEKTIHPELLLVNFVGLIYLHRKYLHLDFCLKRCHLIRFFCNLQDHNLGFRQTTAH